MKTTVIYSNKLQKYDFGQGHPFRSDRFNLFLRLFRKKLGNNESFALEENENLATDEELGIWHTDEYIQAMRAASAGIDLPHLSRFASGDNLNPLTGLIPPGVEEGARAAVKNSIMAIDTIAQGTSEKAVSIGGGLHHAKAGYGEGFCIYNDVAIAARYAMKQYGISRVLVLDTDAHAGNGSCAAFYADPRVLFIDLHQAGIYPGTGAADEIGEGKAKGFTINLPLVAGTGDAAYRLIFDEVIFPVAAQFQPELIIRYGGSDPHYQDSLTQLGLTLAGFKMIGEKVRQLSETVCGGKSADLICSGYNLDVLPKAWICLLAALGGAEIEFEQEYPRRESEKVEETRKLIEQVQGNLRPFWKSMR